MSLLHRLERRLRDHASVRWLKAIFDSYDQAGGGLLAAGLAFNALFAILPAILLLTGLVGIFVGDPDRLASLAADLSIRFPPLAVFFHEALSGLATGGVTFSIVGFVALVWGASRFYDSLDNAIARIFEGSRRRGPVERGVRGILAVLILTGSVCGVIVVSNLSIGTVAGGLPGDELVTRLATSTAGSILVSIGLFSVGAGVIYRIVPTRQPSWWAIGRPALAVGFFAGVLTSLFALLAPRLIGSLLVYGAFVAVLAAMIWLSFVSQALLIGAAWVHRRAAARSGASTAGTAGGDGT